MERWVEISFDCLPLRSIGRLDIPIDASPKYRQQLEAVKLAMERHGTHNAYYLFNAKCTYHLVNSLQLGMLEFRFSGTLFTDESDEHAQRADLDVQLVRETCDWLTEPVVQWFSQTVERSVMVEFDRYVAAGDLEKTRQRLAQLQAQADASGGYLGLYL